MTSDVTAPYRRAQDGFDAVLAAVPSDGWGVASACAGWSVRDVAGHAVWGQEQLAAWATGRDYGCRDGAPGAPRPGGMAGDDVLATWRAARAAADETLTEGVLERTVALGPLGDQPLSAIVTLLVTDLLAHSWDIAHAFGHDLHLDPDLVAGSFGWARANVVRLPGFFGPELTPPAGADGQTRWLAYLGRAAWQPVAA